MPLQFYYTVKNNVPSINFSVILTFGAFFQRAENHTDYDATQVNKYHLFARFNDF